jgi:ectoine hydroxylase-related dioxygenase (phytanoyl-CoA dioxygenase family)
MSAAGELAARGFAALGPVLAPGEIDRLRTAADRLATGAHPGPYGRIVHDPWRRDPAFAELLAARVAPVACAVAGPLVLFQDTLIVKPPGGAAAINWHQDYAYWPLDRPAGLTVWIALDDADLGNGCLRYLAGTHRLGERRPADFAAGASMPARPDLPPLDGEARAADAVAAPVRAGAGLAHDPLVWHMSPANPTPRPRRAWSISLVAPAVRWDPDHAPHPFTAGGGPSLGDPLDPDRFPGFGVTGAATSSAAPPRSPR